MVYRDLGIGRVDLNHPVSESERVVEWSFLCCCDILIVLSFHPDSLMTIFPLPLYQIVGLFLQHSVSLEPSVTFQKPVRWWYGLFVVEWEEISICLVRTFVVWLQFFSEFLPLVRPIQRWIRRCQEGCSIGSRWSRCRHLSPRSRFQVCFVL